MFHKHAGDDSKSDEDSFDPEGAFDDATEFNPVPGHAAGSVDPDASHPPFGDGDAEGESLQRAHTGGVKRSDETVIDNAALKSEIDKRLAELDGYETEDTPLKDIEAAGGKELRYETDVGKQATLQDGSAPSGSKVAPTLPGKNDERVANKIQAALNKGAQTQHDAAAYDQEMPAVDASDTADVKPGFEPTIASVKMPMFDEDATMEAGLVAPHDPDRTSAYVVAPDFDAPNRSASSASQELEPVVHEATISTPEPYEEPPPIESLDDATRAAPIPHELLQALSRDPSVAKKPSKRPKAEPPKRTAKPAAKQPTKKQPAAKPISDAPPPPANIPKRRPSTVEVTPVMNSPKARDDTDLDLAAMIGVPARPPSVQEPEPEPEPARATPSRGGLADNAELKVGLDDIFESNTKDRKAKDRKNKDKKKPPKKRGPAPRDGPSASQLHRLSDATGNIAKIIPLGLGIFVIVATVLISLSFFETSSKQKHVELRFLAMGEDEAPALRRVAEGGTRLFVETKPPDVLVLYGGKILGKTPLSINIPLEVIGPVGVELNSPYFERWLTQTDRNITGELRIEADLELRR